MPTKLEVTCDKKIVRPTLFNNNILLDDRKRAYTHKMPFAVVEKHILKWMWQNSQGKKIKNEKIR